MRILVVAVKLLRDSPYEVELFLISFPGASVAPLPARRSTYYGPSGGPNLPSDRSVSPLDLYGSVPEM